MKTRNLLTLYTLLLNAYRDKEPLRTGGICFVMHDIPDLTPEEHTKLRYDFHNKRKPSLEGSRFAKFAKHPLWSNGGWWWKGQDREALREQRILFLEAIVNYLAKKTDNPRRKKFPRVINLDITAGDVRKADGFLSHTGCILAQAGKRLFKLPVMECLDCMEVCSPNAQPMKGRESIFDDQSIIVVYDHEEFATDSYRRMQALAEGKKSKDVLYTMKLTLRENVK